MSLPNMDFGIEVVQSRQLERGDRILDNDIEMTVISAVRGSHENKGKLMVTVDHRGGRIQKVVGLDDEVGRIVHRQKIPFGWWVLDPDGNWRTPAYPAGKGWPWKSHPDLVTRYDQETNSTTISFAAPSLTLTFSELQALSQSLSSIVHLSQQRNSELYEEKAAIINGVRDGLPGYAYRFAIGDRVDWADANTDPQGTPGTIIHLAHHEGKPGYVVRWDDDNSDAPVCLESNLVPLPA